MNSPGSTGNKHVASDPDLRRGRRRKPHDLGAQAASGGKRRNCTEQFPKKSGRLKGTLKTALNDTATQILEVANTLYNAAIALVVAVYLRGTSLFNELQTSETSHRPGW